MTLDGNQPGYRIPETAAVDPPKQREWKQEDLDPIEAAEQQLEDEPDDILHSSHIILIPWLAKIHPFITGLFVNAYVQM